ncbi:hypothetical protein G4B88_005110, partial [Cannabis sativa]
IVKIILLLLKKADDDHGHHTKISSSKLPPGPWKLPLVGNMHQLIIISLASNSSLPHYTLRDLAKKHGPFMYLKIGQVPTLIVTSPKYAEEIMRSHDIAFASRPQILASKIMSYDCTGIVFAPYGEYWKQIRKICMQVLLNPKTVQTFQPIREQELLNLVQEIAAVARSDSMAINFTEKVIALTYNIISRAAFGKKSSDHEEFILIVKDAINYCEDFEIGELFPFLSFLDKWGKGAKYESLKLKASKILENIINEKSSSSSSSTEKSGKEEDLVDVLLKFHNNVDLGFNVTKENIKAVILDIFIVGSETSSITLDWAMSELMKNPRVMKKAQDEVRKVVGTKGLVDEELINKMKYLKSVIKETLRLHPPAPLLPRICRDNCEINGYQIPMNTRVVVNLWAIGRDPKYWIEPENFMPERFVDSSIDFKGNNFEYIPFGSGRRICPGMSFGLINIELPLAYLLYYFDWKLPNGINHQNLDMTELFGVTIKRRDNLHLIPQISN